MKAMTPAQRISLLGGDDTQAILSEEHTGLSLGIPELGVPGLLSTDGPLGVAIGKSTQLPSNQSLAANFDLGTARRYGKTVAAEARRKGMDLLFGPNVDVMRTPLSGRAFETMGEDPYLITQLGTNWVSGVQSQGVIATAKHFAANNQEGYGGTDADLALPGNVAVPLGSLAHEGSRFTVNARVGERALREIYMAPYEPIVKKAGAVMCSYNRLNGDYACENRRLLQGYLRKQFGFQGMVIADYSALHDPAKAIKAGLDYEPWPGVNYGQASVENLVETGQVSQDEVDARVRAYLRTLFRFGLFDRPAYPVNPGATHWKLHDDFARAVSTGGTVMLKNDGILPLKGGSVALIGAGADRQIKGGGSSNVDTDLFVSPLDTLTARLGASRVRYADGSDLESAVAAAEQSDTAIVFAADYLTEGVDRRCLRLECPPAYGDEDSLIRAVAAANPRTVVVLETGGPVLTPWRGEIKALLEAWYPGQAFGPAIGDILFGKSDPGGRLPSTFPRRESQIPLYGDGNLYPGIDDQLSYRDGVDVGYRSYRARGAKPAYPFGFGLSYGKFSAAPISEIKPLKGEAARLRVKITNTGRRSGTAVPQLYLGLGRAEKGALPPIRLVGFRKVGLKPGQFVYATFRLTRRDLSVFRPEGGGWRLIKRCPKVHLGWSSADLFSSMILPLSPKCLRLRG